MFIRSDDAFASLFVFFSLSPLGPFFRRRNNTSAAIHAFPQQTIFLCCCLCAAVVLRSRSQLYPTVKIYDDSQLDNVKRNTILYENNRKINYFL